MTRRRLVQAVGGAGLVAAAAAAAWLGILPGAGGRYGSPTPELAAAYRAKDGCTCLFVLQRTAEDCAAWTRTAPEVASFEPVPGEGAVRSRALLFWSARARYLGPRAGCRLE